MALPNKVVRLRPAQGSGGAFNQLDAPVAASQTIKMGDFVSLSSGKVQQALSMPGSANSAQTSGGSTSLLGVAMADITTDSNGIEAVTGRTTVPVAILDSNLEVTLRIFNATATSSTQSSIALGTAYRLCRVRRDVATDWFYAIDAGASTTNGELRLVEACPDSASGDQYGLVSVKAIDSVRQF